MNSLAVRLLARNCARCAFSAPVARTFVSSVVKSHVLRVSAINGAPVRRLFATEQSSALSPEMKSKIDQMVKQGNSKVVVFMKGVPDQPKCGFSNAVVQIFRMHGVNDFDAYDVLASDELRQGIKEYSDWPTVPQVYIDGEFVGGCDILLQMHRSGDLIDALKKVGIESKIEENAPSS